MYGVKNIAYVNAVFSLEVVMNCIYLCINVAVVDDFLF